MRHNNTNEPKVIESFYYKGQLFELLNNNTAMASFKLIPLQKYKDAKQYKKNRILKGWDQPIKWNE